jgi:selenocysteine lyase/cysteine desulfurase
VAEFDAETGELPLEAVERVLSERTRLVAVTAASNAIGTRPEVRAISELAHAAGALVYVDGVHATPHFAIDVGALGADFYACSAYKFCGPHIGAVIADPGLLERLRPAKLVPAPGDRRARLLASFAAIEARLHELLARLVNGLAVIDGVRVLGQPRRRTSTVSFVVEGQAPAAVAAGLASEGIAVWDGDNYARELMRRFGLAETGGAVRASIVLYNTAEETDRLIGAVARLAGHS